MLLTLALLSLPQDPLVPISNGVLDSVRFADLNGDGLLDRMSLTDGFATSVNIALGAPGASSAAAPSPSEAAPRASPSATSRTTAIWTSSRTARATTARAFG